MKCKKKKEWEIDWKTTGRTNMWMLFVSEEIKYNVIYEHTHIHTHAQTHGNTWEEKW